MSGKIKNTYLMYKFIRGCPFFSNHPVLSEAEKLTYLFNYGHGRLDRGCHALLGRLYATNIFRFQNYNFHLGPSYATGADFSLVVPVETQKTDTPIYLWDDTSLLCILYY